MPNNDVPDRGLFHHSTQKKASAARAGHNLGAWVFDAALLLACVHVGIHW
jgi:hypothetical protein